MTAGYEEDVTLSSWAPVSVWSTPPWNWHFFLIGNEHESFVAFCRLPHHSSKR